MPDVSENNGLQDPAWLIFFGSYWPEFGLRLLTLSPGYAAFVRFSWFSRFFLAWLTSNWPKHALLRWGKGLLVVLLRRLP